MNRFLPLWRSIALVLGSLAVGWWVTGWWAAPDRTDGVDQNDGPSKPGRMTTFGKGSLDAEFASVTAAGGADDQMAAAVALAGRIDPKDFAEFLDNLRHLPAHAAQGLASRTVLRRWVALDPAAALQWCATHDRDLVDGVLDEWVRNTPPDQIAGQLEQIPASHRVQAIPSLFNGLATHDPEAAMDLLSRPGASSTMHRISQALDQLALRDPDWLVERAESLPDQVRQRVRGAAARAMMETGAAEALAWVMAQPDRNSLMTNLSEKPKFLPSLLAAAAAMPPSEQQFLRLRFLIPYNLNSSEATAIVDSIVTHHGQLSNYIVVNMLGNVGYALVRADDPGALADRVIALGDAQNFQVGSFASLWARRSPEEARAWAASLTDETKRRKAIEAIDGATRPPVDAPPASLVEQLTAQATLGELHEPHRLLALTGDQRRQVLQAEFHRMLRSERSDQISVGSWSTLSSRYPEETASLLRESLTAENTTQLMQPLVAVATQLAAENPRAAADWAATLPPGEARGWAAANVVGQWRLYDESAARAWVESLPPDEGRIAEKGLGGSEPGR